SHSLRESRLHARGFLQWKPNGRRTHFGPVARFFSSQAGRDAPPTIDPTDRKRGGLTGSVSPSAPAPGARWRNFGGGYGEIAAAIRVRRRCNPAITGVPVRQ